MLEGGFWAEGVKEMPGLLQGTDDRSCVLRDVLSRFLG